ncbi:nucleotide-binding universal stress UspA family protein [Actinokineospora baliensis]|uniref:universal stress protein n=1 Tax=Actinokineospora baliensis TaxID=547056 RepID=UPI0027DAE1CC|nr:universal stress protein [Actinokineospora baliensis]MBM7770243.1 nucleotide-binding universal stress UspA family protein [Actinokineospora baliensis]
MKDGLAVIVVGVDGSQASLNAFAWSAGLARREHAKLVLVYVEPLANPAYWTGIGVAGAREAAEAYVDELRLDGTRYLDPIGVAWDVVHIAGDPARGIEAAAEQVGADCIVVGRSRQGRVTRNLIADAARPVVVVP